MYIFIWINSVYIYLCACIYIHICVCIHKNIAYIDIHILPELPHPADRAAWAHPTGADLLLLILSIYKWYSHRRFIIQRGHEHTRTGNWSESGFGSLRGAPWNTSSIITKSDLYRASYIYIYMYSYIYHLSFPIPSIELLEHMLRVYDEYIWYMYIHDFLNTTEANLYPLLYIYFFILINTTWASPSRRSSCWSTCCRYVSIITYIFYI